MAHTGSEHTGYFLVVSVMRLGREVMSLICDEIIIEPSQKFFSFEDVDIAI